MPRLAMWFLGSFRAALDEDPVCGIEYDKVRALLAYLALESERPHRRETLAGLLWPDLPERRARRNLSQALFNLRRTIQPPQPADGGSPYLLVDRQSIQFNPASDHWLDVRTFLALLSSCREHAHWRLETCPRCAPLLKQATALYRGPFLHGLSIPDSPAFEEWQLVWRERLRSLASEALGALAAHAEVCGAYDRALAHARRWIELDPWHEGAHQRLMHTLALSGQRTSALAQYDRCRRTLADELGTEPTPETDALYRAIRDGEALEPTVRPLPNNLPASLTSFVGREVELARLTTLFLDPGCRLVSLVGPGGIGKTRLALQFARDVAAQAPGERFADGIAYTPLAPVPSPAGIVPAVIQALDVSVAAGRGLWEGLLDYLRRRRTLLVLDNVEHLIAPAAERDVTALVTQILRAAPGVGVLVTSRARLNVSGEHVLPLSGLPYPPSPALPAADLGAYGAVQLFLQTAGRACPDPVLPDADLAHVATVCQMVEGMPLALLLAAAWSEVLSPAEIAARIRRGLGFLAADMRDLPPRQRSMVAAFDSAWALLDEAEHTVFAQLSVFRGGFTGEAAQAVAGAGPETLRKLIHKSFLARNASGRYEIHELLRQYGARKLQESPGQKEQALDRHCATYAEFLERGEIKFRERGPRERHPEADNVRAAWEWALGQAKLPEIRRSLIGLFWFEESSSWRGELVPKLERAIALLREAPPQRENQVALGLACCQCGCSLVEGGEIECGRRLAREGLALLRDLGAWQELAQGNNMAVGLGVVEGQGAIKRLLKGNLPICRKAGSAHDLAWTHALLGKIAHQQGAYEEAEQHYRSNLAISQRIHSRRAVAIGVLLLGELAYARQEAALARQRCEQALALFRESGNREWVVTSLYDLGDASRAMGDLESAGAHYRECLSHAEALGDRYTAQYALCGLGDTALAGGEAQEARGFYHRALHDALEDRAPRLGRILFSFARLLVQEREPERALELLALALAQPDLWSRWGHDAKRFLDEVQGALPPQDATAALERGQARNLDATVEELLAGRGT
jgi:predicted ATPase/DNA-binding SARP family transcriptional activator